MIIISSVFCGHGGEIPLASPLNLTPLRLHIYLRIIKSSSENAPPVGTWRNQLLPCHFESVPKLSIPVKTDLFIFPYISISGSPQPDSTTGQFSGLAHGKKLYWPSGDLQQHWFSHLTRRLKKVLIPY